MIYTATGDPYRLLVDGITDYAIYLLDPNGRVSSWNAGAERFKGYKAHEILGRSFALFYTPEDRETHLPQRALATAAAAGRFEREGWRVRKDGRRFWAHVIIDAIRGDDGQLLGFAKITRDLTERREAQQALEAAQQALFQAQKLEAIGQLTGGIAHDFNNLLMAVIGSIELIRKRIPDDPQLLALLDNAAQGAQRGATLTRRMLSFARRQDLNRAPIDVGQLVEGMRDLLDRSIGPQVTIEVVMEPGVRLVMTDPHQLETALLNLVVNARDAMPGGGRIVISAHNAAIAPGHRTGLTAGAYVELVVADDGEGMDSITAMRATEPFFTTKGVGKGTGLGLSMVHGLAEQSGGRLEVESAPGEGTAVRLWLPVAVDCPVAAEIPAMDVKTRRTERPMRILAVDDDGLVLSNTIAMLEDLGHTVHAAASAAAAIAVLDRETGIDLVITDHAMPGMTGVELAGAIAARWPDLPVVIATGYADWAEGEAADIPRLAKPFTQAQLAQVLGHVADQTVGAVPEAVPAGTPQRNGPSADRPGATPTDLAPSADTWMNYK